LIPLKDFSKQKHFPGTHGNPFDIALHKLEELDGLPFLYFLLIVVLISFGGTLLYLVKRTFLQTGLLLLFILLDWLLIFWLPHKKRSFGPVKPAVLQLAIGRSIFALVPLPLWGFLALQTLGTAAMVYGFWVEPFQVRVTHMQLASPKLPKGTVLKVLHLGDLHMERRTIREERLLLAIQQLQPDVILFSGDILNLSYLHDPLAWQEARAVLRQLHAPLGTFLVSGSPAVDLPEILPGLLKDLPVHLLHDEMVFLPVGSSQITLIGTYCSHRPFVDGPILEQLWETLNIPDQFSILLHHSPDIAPFAARLGFDLQLSGHTHGGQVCLPWYGALFTASLYGKQFEAGPYHLNSMLLYITRGIGLEGAGAPRVRFLCPPEIILWEITSSEN
jgi:predicted MPP superfamily phosphohydrolase